MLRETAESKAFALGCPRLAEYGIRRWAVGWERSKLPSVTCGGPAAASGGKSNADRRRGSLLLPHDWWEDLMTQRVLGPTGSRRRRRSLLVPPIVVTVSLQPAGGPERILGQAWTNRTTDLRYNGLAPQGEYRLVARTTDNRAMASEIMVLDNVAALEWSLQSNLVTVLSTRNP